MSQLAQLFAKLPVWQQVLWVGWAIVGLILLATALITLGKQGVLASSQSTSSQTAQTPHASSDNSRRNGNDSRAVVVFLHVPSAKGGPITGTIRNLDTPERHKVVVFAKTDKWYVQPTEGVAALAAVQHDGSWATWTNPGSQFVALIVAPNYDPPAKADTPPITGTDIVAFAIVDAAP
jgi:hypothetical protein